ETRAVREIEALAQPSSENLLLPEIECPCEVPPADLVGVNVDVVGYRANTDFSSGTLPEHDVAMRRRRGRLCGPQQQPRTANSVGAAPRVLARVLSRLLHECRIPRLSWHQPNRSSGEPPGPDPAACRSRASHASWAPSAASSHAPGCASYLPTRQSPAALARG